jgi:hypothetical protein
MYLAEESHGVSITCVGSSQKVIQSSLVILLDTATTLIM